MFAVHVTWATGDALFAAIENLDAAQQLAADVAAKRLDRHYDRRDWTGRRAQYTQAFDWAFNLQPGESFGLIDGSTIELAEYDA